MITETQKIDWSRVFFGTVTSDKMEGWCTPEKAQALYDLVTESDAKLCVELGVFGGKSLIAMALACRDKGSGGVIGFDPWNNSACIEGSNSPANDQWWLSLDLKAIYRGCLAAIERNGVFEQCNTVKMKSEDAAKLFADSVCDIIHQDGNHNVESITKELKLWVPKLKKGGYWICDDVDWIEASEGYAKLPEYGLEMTRDFSTWQIWKKIK